MSEELAGEFVLGALEPDERAAVELRMRDGPDFRRCVDAWTGRLTPLADRVAKVKPPASAWVGDPPVHRRRRAVHLCQQSEDVWLEVAPGTTLKTLRVDPVTGERTGLMRMDPGSAVIRRRRSVSCSNAS